MKLPRFFLFPFALFLASCQNGVPLNGVPNPLDVPGERPPTAAELHGKNVAIITGNPARALR